MLVNNAGYGLHGAFARDDPQEQLRMLQVNVIALTLTRLLLPGMIERRRGRVLNVASTAAFQPGPLMAVYRVEELCPVAVAGVERRSRRHRGHRHVPARAPHARGSGPGADESVALVSIRWRHALGRCRPG